ncbi:MAG TPA: fumarylacetoacetate hydrolase family protein [Candidatus Binatia bacterium]|nr:fumarylacetoacetate hydrolase family protein [Candidatus Binatia bacterium]
MKLYLGLTESSSPHQTRVFVELSGKLVDLNLAYAAYLALEGEKASAYELSAFYFPDSIEAFLERGELALEALEKLSSFVRKNGARDLRGPAGEKVAYDPVEIRILPPIQKPEKSIVIGFSDQARIEAIPRAEIPTGFYKLPQTFVTTGMPIVLPKFSEEVDADACLAIMIGKAGKRVSPDQAWQYVAGVTLLIDITARDINRREGLTTNNLLGKNFPSSTSLGPAMLLKPERKELEAMKVELSVDGSVKQRFALRDCVFTIEQVIARWSILGIKPGDLLAIGASMALQADRLQNPVPLKAGSNLSCFSPQLGELSQPVVSAGGLRG